jgi:hypothetical protein
MHHADHSEIVVLPDGDTFAPSEGATIRYVPQDQVDDIDFIEHAIVNDELESERVLSASDVIDVAGSLLEPSELDANPEYFRALAELCNQLRARPAFEIEDTERELREAAAR